MAKKYVITGGQGEGKTKTLVGISQGIYTIGEAATYIINLEQKKANPIVPWTDIKAFQELVLKTQQQWEREIPEGIEKAILDRGLGDGIAYYLQSGLKPPTKLIDATKNAGYEKVFILDPLQTYERTDVRREDEETAKRLHTLLGQAYKELGYKTERIPALPKTERVQYLLERIR